MELAILHLGSSLNSKEHRLTTWPSNLGLGPTGVWLLPYHQGASPHYLALPPAWLLPCLQKASPRCLALPPSTRPNCSLAPPLPPRSIALRLAPTTWDWEKLQLGSSLTSKEHRLAAWPSHLGLGHTTAWHLPYLEGASPCCLALPHGTRPYCSLGPPLPPRNIVLLLGLPTWDSALLQVGSSLTYKEHHLTASPSHLGLDKSEAWLLPYLQGASPRCLALPPWTWPNYSLAAPLPPRTIALLLGPPTWDSAKLQLCSCLNYKDIRLASWPSHLGLIQTAAWLLLYVKGASPRCMALPPGFRPNCSLAPPLPPRSISSLLGPPILDLAKLQLGCSLTSKEHRLAASPSHTGLGQTTAWPSHLGLSHTAAWLLLYLQGASL
ncbi:hypothetical protein Adt_35086 [Abeliophyllum distichum]|uniref:Uncharacterized protein n=1 Tax=Abeliophyllum distichum TaxID=126358 RepID=A0ABD1QDQ9_9LAMI